MSALLLLGRSGADLGIRISWKPNVTVHLPRVSLLTPPEPRTRSSPSPSPSPSPSKTPARADSHAATARTSVEFWLGVPCVCVHVCTFHSCVRPDCVRPSHSSQHWLLLGLCLAGVLQVAAMSRAEARRGNHFYWIPQKKKKENLQQARTHILLNFFFFPALSRRNRHTRKYFAHRRPPLAWIFIRNCDELWHAFLAGPWDHMAGVLEEKKGRVGACYSGLPHSIGSNHDGRISQSQMDSRRSLKAAPPPSLALWFLKDWRLRGEGGIRAHVWTF